MHLIERYGLRVSAVREQITAALADTEDLRLLKLRSPAPLLVIDEVAFDQSGALANAGLDSYEPCLKLSELVALSRLATRPYETARNGPLPADHYRERNIAN